MKIELCITKKKICWKNSPFIYHTPQSKVWWNIAVDSGGKQKSIRLRLPYGCAQKKNTDINLRANLVNSDTFKGYWIVSENVKTILLPRVICLTHKDSDITFPGAHLFYYIVILVCSRLEISILTPLWLAVVWSRNSAR